MFNLSTLIQDQVPPARTGPGLSFCNDKNAWIFDYELSLRGQTPMRGSKRARNEKDLRRMLENCYPQQIEACTVLKRYKNS
jgi:hypothetical protein